MRRYKWPTPKLAQVIKFSRLTKNIISRVKLYAVTVVYKSCCNNANIKQIHLPLAIKLTIHQREEK